MTEVIAGGIAGLLLGMAAQRCGLTNRENVAGAIALRRRGIVKCVLWGLGLGAVLVAFLSWLAVIDVDMLTVLPLHGGTLAGGVIFGLAAGVTGLLPGTAPTVMGGGRFLEGLCGVAGCAVGAALLPYTDGIANAVTPLIPASANTLFQVTLDEPFLFAGGFLGQACVGAVLMALAIIIRPEPSAEPAEPAPEEAPPVSTKADEVRAETVVVALPEEEPVVVDTALDEDAAPADEEKPDDEPIMPDHPDLDAPPEHADDWTEDMARLEEAAGQGTPAQEEALPVGAKAVGDPERREAEEADPDGEDQLG